MTDSLSSEKTVSLETPGGAAARSPRLHWEAGSAYDLFISQVVLHAPERFGLRASWAAGVRSRLPAEARQALETARLLFGAPLHWIHALPQPRDAASALWVLHQMLPEERLPRLALYPEMNPELQEMLQNVAARRSWMERDLEVLHEARCQERREALRPKPAASILDAWAQAGAFGEAYLAALRTYQQVFFAEEEQRIRLALQAALEQAQLLAQELELPEVLERLSRGVQIPDLFEKEDLTLVPSYWGAPLIFLGRLSASHTLLAFGARPANVSLVPGEWVPEALVQALKALADPTRLRILRYLAGEPLSPTELSRRLRLRAPTVTHHLSALRLAGLVHLTLGPRGERDYSARLEAVYALRQQLQEFLEDEGQEGDKL
ncbi:MAG: metalloregulator ArsR/SmtB family transcription factor [Chloroflexota bacterium]